VYIGQCETIEWIILYYIRLRSGLMMSKGHTVTSRGRENKSDHNNVTCKEKKMKFNTKRRMATDEHRKSPAVNVTIFYKNRAEAADQTRR